MNELPVRVVIPQPDDWHLHLRDDAMLAAVVGYSARHYRYAMVMPNLRPPIVSTAAATAYRDRILTHLPAEVGDFRPLLTLFASAELDPADLAAGAQAGVVKAVKFYPSGATTNADQAKGALADFDALYDVLVEHDLRLLVHAESTRDDVDVFDREAAFLTDELLALVTRRPELAITLEHVSTRAGIDFVREHANVAATITPHHLARDRGDLLANGLRPDLYCKPIINAPEDRAALVAAVTTAQHDFMLGTDSAPHATAAKYAPTGAAGVFNAPYGLEVVAEVFHQAQALEHLAAFVSHNGCRLYGVASPSATLQLTRHSAPAAELPADTLVTATGETVVFFGTEEARWWQIDPGPTHEP